MYHELKEVNSWNVICLEHSWKFMKALLLYKIIHVSLFFSLTGGTEIVNAQGSDKD